MAQSREERIKELLDERKMTARELAERIGVTETSMSMYTHNGRTPKADILAMIARELGTTMDYLETGSNWIPLTERMPEKGKEVLVTAYGWENDYNDIYVGKLQHTPANDGSANFFGIPTPESEWALENWSYYKKPDVVAWMPLPEAYKKED